MTLYQVAEVEDGELYYTEAFADCEVDLEGLSQELERLILLDFSAVRQRGKVELRPGLDHLKCVKNETKIIKWEALYMILFM